MNQYETVIVLTPLLSEEVAKEAIAKFSKIITDSGAEIVQEDNWGLRKLAYPIEKNSFAYAVEDATTMKGTTRIRLDLFFPVKGTFGNSEGLSDPLIARI
ncbi:30S ribosomal protein S6 [Pedobacter sp.]|uniref:30S ribosomal protein S6 n=1 Tax=Pedobacter sp. TaxID=1411316 RepID=UPI003D7F50F8